ncbi:hypothetical protein L1D50_23280, partial [Pseudoalteromonas sp. Isolate6]
FRVIYIVLGLIIVSLLGLNTFLLYSQTNIILEQQASAVASKRVKVKEVEPTPVTKFFFQCLEYRRPISRDPYDFEVVDDERPSRGDIEACKKVALELAEK